MPSKAAVAGTAAAGDLVDHNLVSLQTAFEDCAEMNRLANRSRRRCKHWVSSRFGVGGNLNSSGREDNLITTMHSPDYRSNGVIRFGARRQLDAAFCPAGVCGFCG
jgi:hypothetical protein